ALGSSAVACHVSGAAYCDENTNGVVDVPGDLPIPGVTVGATSLDLGSGQYTASTDASGSYDIVLPTQNDRYLVGPIGLPAGLTVVLPSGGTYTAQIVVDTAQDHVDGLDLLVQGCAPNHDQHFDHDHHDLDHDHHHGAGVPVLRGRPPAVQP